MNVVWTATAQRHLLSIYEYVALDSSRYAQAVVDRLTNRSIQIGRFPEAGRSIPEYDRDDLREVIETPYRILYRVGTDQIDVLAVLHAARRIPEQLD